MVLHLFPGSFLLLLFPFYLHTHINKFNKNLKLTGCWWFTPVILAAQEAEIRRSQFKASLGKYVRPYLEKTITKIGLVLWLKV
jgi:hypothetical protein